MSEIETFGKQNVFITDLEGRAEYLSAVQSRFLYHKIVHLGDGLKGKGTFQTIEALLGADATVVAGNRDILAMMAIRSVGTDYQKDMADALHRDILAVIYPEYGIKIRDNPSTRVAMNALERLARAIQRYGHDQYFDNLIPYFETDDILGIHAGILPNQFWKHDQPQMSQKSSLDGYWDRIKAGELLDDEPIQIFDPNGKLASVEETPGYLKNSKSATRKILVTGHQQLSAATKGRVTSAGKRVRLDAPKSKGAPLYAYDQLNHKVVEISLTPSI